MLAGDRNHVVHKQGVTVAEIEVLRAIHGEDSVSDVQPVKQDSRKHADELARLRRIYRRKLPGPDNSGSKNIVDLIFPGPRPNLPATLKDIGLDYPKEKAPAKGKSGDDKDAE
jgi:hypothetical protein